MLETQNATFNVTGSPVPKSQFHSTFNAGNSGSRIRYSLQQLLLLSKSPLCTPPPGLPGANFWENEKLVRKVGGGQRREFSDAKNRKPFGQSPSDRNFFKNEREPSGPRNQDSGFALRPPKVNFASSQEHMGINTKDETHKYKPPFKIPSKKFDHQKYGKSHSREMRPENSSSSNIGYNRTPDCEDSPEWLSYNPNENTQGSPGITAEDFEAWKSKMKQSSTNKPLEPSAPPSYGNQSMNSHPHINSVVAQASGNEPFIDNTIIPSEGRIHDQFPASSISQLNSISSNASESKFMQMFNKADQTSAFPVSEKNQNSGNPSPMSKLYSNNNNPDTPNFAQSSGHMPPTSSEIAGFHSLFASLENQLNSQLNVSQKQTPQRSAPIDPAIISTKKPANTSSTDFGSEQPSSPGIPHQLTQFARSPATQGNSSATKGPSFRGGIIPSSVLKQLSSKSSLLKSSSSPQPNVLTSGPSDTNLESFSQRQDNRPPTLNHSQGTPISLQQLFGKSLKSTPIDTRSYSTSNTYSPTQSSRNVAQNSPTHPIAPRSTGSITIEELFASQPAPQNKASIQFKDPSSKQHSPANSFLSMYGKPVNGYH